MIALGTDTDGHESLARRRRYRWAYVGSIVAGVLALIVASRLGYPLVGIGLYWIGAATMLAILWGSPISLFDEREQQLEQRASSITLGVIAIAGIAGIPGATALEEAGVIEMTPWMNGLFAGFVLLFAVFGLVMTVLWLRR